MLQLQCDEAGCLGAAMLAGLATGVYTSEEDAVQKAVHVIERVEPNVEIAQRYTEPLKVYQSIYPTLESVHAKRFAVHNG